MESESHNIKGTAFISLKSYCEEHGQIEAFAQAIEEEGLNSRRFLASQWYSAKSYLNIGTRLSFKFRKSPKQFITDTSAYSAKRDLNGIYRAFMKVTGSRLVLSKLPALAGAYTSYLQAKVVVNINGRYLIEFISPSDLYELTTWNFEGATQSMLEVFQSEATHFRQLTIEVFDQEGTSYTQGVWELTYKKKMELVSS